MTRVDRWWASSHDLAIPALIFACVLLTILRYPLAISPDNALILSYGQRILEGQTPYVDFYEINPPLIMYLNVLPVWLGRLVELHAITVFSLLVLGLCVWSTLSIRRTLIEIALPRRGLVLAAWSVLAWSTLFSTQSSFTFGQREHLFVLGYVPFLLVRAVRWSDRSVAQSRAIGIGVVAGVMSAIKPHFVIVALVSEVCWFARHRRRSPLFAPEVAAAVAVGVLYLVHFAVFGEIGRAYFALATDLWSTYATFDAPWSQLANPGRVVWVALAISLFAIAPRGVTGAPARELATGLASFVVASFFLLYLLPQKAWTYHFEPALHGSVLLIALLVTQTELLASRWRASTTIIIAACSLAFALATQLAPGVAGMRIVPNLQRVVVKHTRPGDHVMMLACGVPPTWPLLLQIDRRNASRYSALVNMLPQFYPPDRPFAGYPAPDRIPQREREFLDSLRDDARRHPPRLLVVGRGVCREVAAGFELATYLDKVGFMADVFGEFEKIGDVEDRTPFVLFNFVVFARKGDAG